MSARKQIFFAIAIGIVLLAALAAGCSSPAGRTVKAGDNVTIDYVLRTTDGQVRDTSYEQVAKDAGIYSPAREYAPFTFTVGSGSVIEGFDDGVIGMAAGETRNVTITPDKAYGEYRLDYVLPTNLSAMKASNITPTVNMTLFSMTYMRNGRVDSIDEANDTVYVDFNHALAGKTLEFTITLRSIQ